MFYALSWLAVLSCLALWSLATWSLHAVSVWSVTSAGVLAGGASGSQSLRVPDWLAVWLPREATEIVSSMLASLGPWVGSVLQSVPSLAGGLTVAAWVLWAVGAVALVVLGAVAHVLIAAALRWQRNGAANPPRVATVS